MVINKETTDPVGDKPIDIYGGKCGEFNILSNLADKPFVFRGIKFRTIEGALQAIKTDNPSLQQGIYELSGFTAKTTGRSLNWQQYQTLWCFEEATDRHGDEYQRFLDELYATCYSQNPAFRAALRESGSRPLLHTVGNTDPERTVLTIDEFVSRLLVLREEAKKAP